MDDRVIFKPDKETVFVIILVFVLSIVAFLVMWWVANLYIALVILAIMLFVAFRYWIAFGRTVILSENGCIVQFLKCKKEYRWNELKTKRFVDYNNTLEYRAPIRSRGFELSCKNVKRNRLGPGVYCVLLHPFTFVSICFKTEKTKSSTLLYQVDETVFMEKLENWKVEFVKN